jgi:exodeoxyribonuclease V alpha subunit
MRKILNSLRIPIAVSPYVEAGLVDRGAVISVNTILASIGIDAEESPLAVVALALVMMSPADGGTCVDLESLAQWTFEDEGADLAWSSDVTVWISELDKFRNVIASGEAYNVSPVRPFVLAGYRLYMANSFSEEGSVAEKLASLLIQGRLRVITGGPGSGKTTAIAAQLIERLTLSLDAQERIVLAAPTGLAAKRMKKALADAVLRVNPGPEVVERIEGLKKQTVHKLLAYNPSLRRQYSRNAEKPLEYDLVILDEVSMMPLSMMARLLDALGDETSLILVGDKDQLASVESGNVLADIVQASSDGPSFVKVMDGKHRFKSGSPVAELSDCVNSGDFTQAKAVLIKEFPTGVDEKGDPLPRFSWISPEENAAELERTAQLVLKHALELCERAKSAKDDESLLEVLRFREKLQVICAHKRGALGVSGWNSSIQRAMGPVAKGRWYVGRPVMLTSTDKFHQLSNGDIGFIWADEEKNFFGVFDGTDGIVRVPIAKMGEVETVHALTIHKSQGSEYEHTIVVLPSQPSRILTRELVYTGMTRAKPHLTLISSEDVLTEAIKKKVQRATGLAPRLLKELEVSRSRWPFVKPDDK